MGIHTSISRISRNFDIGDPSSGRFCILSIISPLEKNERCLFWTKIIQIPLKHRVSARLDTLSRNIVSFCSIAAKPLTFGEIWSDAGERSLKGLSHAFLRSTVAFLVPEIYASLSKKCWKRQNLTFGDISWPDLWTNLKNNRNIFVMVFVTLSNAAYRLSLCGPEAEIEGSQEAPHQVVENLEAHQGAG